MALPDITPERQDLGLISPEELTQIPIHERQHVASNSQISGKQQPEDSKSASRYRAWTTAQKIAFRIAFIFFTVISLPTSASWYKNIFSLDWLHLHYRDLYDVARFQPNILGRVSWWPVWLGYGEWVFILLVSAALGLIWTAVIKIRRAEPRDYNLLYYWLRVVVRYRAGIGIIGFGFTKLLPTQLPYPSLGLLNTNFGDLTAQKIYWLSIGIVPWYEVFAGVVEVLAGALLFFRATTFWGAVLLFGALADIVYVNLAYDGGVHGYSSYFVLLSGFLLIYYVKDLYNLLIREQLTIPNYYYPSFGKIWQKIGRIGLKTATIGIFLVLLFWIQYVNFRYDPYKQPAQKGVRELRGNYAVSEFRLNNKEIPYSPVDSLRWQEATFENWSTLTFKVNRPVPLDLSNGGGSPMRDLNRTFELTGVAGGQRVFYYDADPVNHVLYLQDKYRPGRRGEDSEGDTSGKRDRKKTLEKPDNWIPATALANIGPEYSKIEPIALTTRRAKGIKSETRQEDGKRKRMILNYQTTDGSRVVLTGITENKDSIYVVLDRINRPYALSKSTLNAGEYQ
ncbi:hypothetical protein [Spirosoma pollinicola]|uniref:DoxX family protein n=1 Tax=Spirosoma pollinicola TaxID=2057025 RepID=A0A2K8YS14_9BACT|nr:hypothetical protein [Spirosoma pollinicola]AUD00410.1 hypothetical protein CWM47_00395 [Spirosoma pollinicola]